MKNGTTYVALDTHKRQHKVAMILPQQDNPVEWTVQNAKRDVARMVRRIVREAPGEVRICYEAGVCGFALQRQIEAHGAPCTVIAPSLVPIKPGERIKTDRRDARKLAEMYRAGLLTQILAPEEQEESLRDLCRCREAGRSDLMRTRHRLSKFLLRRAIIYRDGDHWTQRHLRWLRSIQFDRPLDSQVFVELVQNVDYQTERLVRLDRSLIEQAEQPAYVERVGYLRCFKGIDTIAAILLLGELYSFGRFGSARQLMSYLGLTPSEHSSGDHRHPGQITRAGNKRVRRLLTQIAWHQGRSCTTSKAVKSRRAGQPSWAVLIGEKAERRLYRRYWHLVHKGKAPAKANIAVARELAGFLWAMLTYSRHDAEREHSPVASRGLVATQAMGEGVAAATGLR